MTDLLTAVEAAARLGRSRGFVLALVADRLVVGHKQRGRWYISRRSLDAWVDGGMVTPNPGRVCVPSRRFHRAAS